MINLVLNVYLIALKAYRFRNSNYTKYCDFLFKILKKKIYFLRLRKIEHYFVKYLLVKVYVKI